MNQIAVKLVEAGVPIPSQTKRIWMFLKEHPQMSAARVSQVLGIPQSSVGSLMSDMIKRGMAERKHETRMVKGPRGSHVKKDVFLYSALGDEYELLPKKTHLPPLKHKQLKAEEKPAARATTVMPATGYEPIAARNTSVDHLTIAQARELYDVLHKMFGDKQ